MLKGIYSAWAFSACLESYLPDDATAAKASGNGLSGARGGLRSKKDFRPTSSLHAVALALRCPLGDVGLETLVLDRGTRLCSAGGGLRPAERLLTHETLVHA